MTSKTEVFNAEKYWASRIVKIFVVSIKNKQKHDVRLIRAKTEQGAIRGAKELSDVKGRVTTFCRLACPLDLGINEK